MVASDSFAEFLREQLAPLGRVTMRRMFGKTGVFCDGLMLGMVTDNMLYFRVDDGNRAAFNEAESFVPLNYKKQGACHCRDCQRLRGDILVLPGCGAKLDHDGAAPSGTAF